MPDPLPGSVHDPATGGVIPASWGDAVNAYAEDQDTGPMCRVYNSSAQSIPNTTWTTITFNGDRYDTEDLHSTVSNTSRLTAPTGKGGMYLVWFGGQMGDTIGSIQARFRNNGSGAYYAIQGTGTAGDTDPSSRYISMAAMVPLAAGDYVEVQIYHDHGSASNLQQTNYSSPEFGMQRMGPLS